MSRILLIAPRKKVGNYVSLPNLGLGYIAEAVQRAGHEVVWWDNFEDWDNFAFFSKYLGENRIDVIGISFYSSNLFQIIQKCVDAIRAADKNVKIILGGAHPTLAPEECTQYIPGIDYVIHGEGEKSFTDLISLIEKSQLTEEHLLLVDNLVWHNGDQWITNQKKFLENLDEIDSPYWDIINPQNYQLAPNGIFTKKTKIAPIVTSRGCPFGCTFCAARHHSGAKVRRRSVQSVIREIKILVQKFGIEEIHIMDDAFTINKKHVMEFCSALINEKLGIVWACPNGVRLDSLDAEILVQMERAGCYSFAVGIESGSDRILKMLDKSLTLSVVREKVSLIKKCTKIEVTGFFIFGLPTETEADIMKTISFAREINLDKANFFNFTPFPGTKLYNELKKEGKVSYRDYENYYIHNIADTYCEVSRKRLMQLQRIAYLKFYLNPRILVQLLRKIRSFSQVKMISKRVTKIMLQHC